MQGLAVETACILHFVIPPQGRNLGSDLGDLPFGKGTK